MLKSIFSIRNETLFTEDGKRKDFLKILLRDFVGIIEDFRWIFLSITYFILQGLLIPIIIWTLTLLRAGFMAPYIAFPSEGKVINILFPLCPTV